MNAVRVCDILDWSFEEYMNSPKWFVHLMIHKKVIDSDHAKKK